MTWIQVPILEAVAASQMARKSLFRNGSHGLWVSPEGDSVGWSWLLKGGPGSFEHSEAPRKQGSVSGFVLDQPRKALSVFE